MILLLLACEEGATAESAGGAAEEYAGPVGRYAEYVPLGVPDSPTTSIVVSPNRWDLTWADGTFTISSWTLDDAGFAVDGTLLLPDRLAPGTVGEGVTVTEHGEYAVWYGTFPDCVTVEVAAGAFAGTQVFARDIGPIAMTWNGSWELVYYE